MRHDIFSILLDLSILFGAFPLTDWEISAGVLLTVSFLSSDSESYPSFCVTIILPFTTMSHSAVENLCLYIHDNRRFPCFCQHGFFVQSHSLPCSRHEKNSGVPGMHVSRYIPARSPSCMQQ